MHDHFLPFTWLTFEEFIRKLRHTARAVGDRLRSALASTYPAGCYIEDEFVVSFSGIIPGRLKGPRLEQKFIGHPRCTRVVSTGPF